VNKKPMKPSYHFTSDRFRRQDGMSLVESVIGLLVLTIVFLSGAQMLRVNVLHLALSERARIAENKGNDTLSSLAAFNQSSLPDVNPINGKSATDNIADGEPLSINANTCVTSYSCDRVVKLPQTIGGTGYDYVAYDWNQALPTNGTVAYYRAWRVTTLDAVRHLRRITVVVLPTDQGNNPGDSVTPLALRISDVVQRQ
jgi:hypothetical protein